jgi:hypothetical protein
VTSEADKSATVFLIKESKVMKLVSAPVFCGRAKIGISGRFVVSQIRPRELPSACHMIYSELLVHIYLKEAT